MKNYVELLKHARFNGVDKLDRTGVGSRSVFGQTLSWDLAEGFPILTIRRVALRIAFEETMFFLRGETDTKKLEEKKINIWKGNTSREFLDGRGLYHLPEGSIGKGYSHQWRNFGGNMGVQDGVDQMADLFNSLRDDPFGRRHVVTAWNPQQLKETPLPPCHIMQMYSVADSRLHSSFVMRSNDIPFGLPYNIMGYALLNHLYAKALNLSPGTLTYFGHDAHIYHNQLEMVNELITRQPHHDLPQLLIHKDIASFDDMLTVEFSDVELIGYNPLPDISNKPAMAK